MNCISCNENLKQNANFCHSCGEKVVKIKKCGNCGQELKQQDVFCSQCGEKYENGVNQLAEFDEDSNERLAGVSLANQNKSWINDYNGWIYIQRVGIWRMREDGSEIKCINDGYQSFYNNNLNVNKHGIFFIDYDRGLVHLNHEGQLINEFSNIKGLFFVYDQDVYFTDWESQTAFLYKMKIDGSNRRLLKSISPKYDGSDAPDYIQKLSANGSQVAFYIWTEDNERTGWYIMNTDGTGFEKIQYQYRVESWDNEDEYETRELSIYYIDLEKGYVYTSSMPSEEDGIWERKMDAPITDNSNKKRVWEVIPWAHSNPNMDIFHMSNDDAYFDGKACYGFTHQHKGININKENYYYNLYTVYPNGESEFLNAGSRGGIEQLAVIGDYAYFDQEFAIRAKLDGSGMEQGLKNWEKKTISQSL